MPTVAIFRSRLLPASETFVRAQARALVRWSPVLVGDQRVEDGLDLSGLDVRLLPTPSAAGGLGGALRYCLQRAPASSIALIRATGARLVHVHFATDAVDVWPVVRRARLPMLVTLHGYDATISPGWWRAGHVGWRRRLYPQRLMRLAQQPGVAFVAVSEALRQRAIALGIPADRVGLSYVGVDTERFVPPGVALSARSPRVLFIGRLVEKKGLRYLIQAMERVCTAIPGSELVVVGDGAERAAMMDQARERHVAAAFLGALDEEGVRAQLAQAQVLCLPSVEAANGDAEGFGLVLLEAQASGVPVVTSALGGAREGLREGETGHAFAPGDVPTLARHLVALLSDPPRLDAMSVAARRFARDEFDMRRTTAVLEAHYDRLACDGAGTCDSTP